MARTGFAFTGAQADQDVVAATAGKSIRILRIGFSTSAAATIKFTDGADATATRVVAGLFPAGYVHQTAVGHGSGLLPVATLTKGNALKVTSDVGNILGTIEYVLV